MHVLVDLGHTRQLRSPDHELLTLARTLAGGDPVTVLIHEPQPELSLIHISEPTRQVR